MITHALVSEAKLSDGVHPQHFAAIREKQEEQLIYRIAIGQNGDILIGGSRIFVFTHDGKLPTVINPTDFVSDENHGNFGHDDNEQKFAENFTNGLCELPSLCTDE